jgi:hypothetical protein
MSRAPDSISDDLDALPPRLAADLNALQRTPEVPPAVDRAIAAHARRYFTRQRSVRLWTRWGGGAAAAAVLLLGLKIAFNTPPHFQRASEMAAAPPAAMAPPLLRGDIDHNGVVNVLDALAVARGIKTHQIDMCWDLNGDGKIDQADVDEIAMTAVKVKGGAQ